MIELFWFTFVIIGFTLMFSSVALQDLYSRNVDRYCDDIETTCNHTTTIINDTILSQWSTHCSKICEYDGTKKNVGWKLIDCFFDPIANKCPSSDCTETKSMRNRRNEYMTFMWVGLGFVGGGSILSLMLGILVQACSWKE